MEAYRDMGLLPEAVRNYLLRLGWGHGDDEIIADADAIRWFDLSNIGRAPSRFDTKKMESLNGHYLREADDGRLAALAAPLIEAQIGSGIDASGIDLLRRAMPVLKIRAKDLNELAEGAGFLFRTRPIDMDEKATALLGGSATDLLGQLHAGFASIGDWNEAAIEAVTRAVAERGGVGLGKVAQPLRAALTGRTTSPGIFDVALLLGRTETLGRLEDRSASAT